MIRHALLATILLVAACRPTPVPQTESSVASSAAVPVAAELPASLEDDGNDVAFWLHPADAAQSLLLASAGTAGLEAFALDGRRVAHFNDGEFDYVAVAEGFEFGGRTAPIVVGYDRRDGGLRILTVDPATRAIGNAGARVLDTGGEVVGLCLWRSPNSGSQYAFAAVDGGTLQQWQLFARGDRVDGRLVRSIPVGAGAGYCAVDPGTGTLYATEEAVGIWRFAAEPETDAERQALDLVVPFGRIAEEVKGIALRPAADGQALLVASDVAAGRFLAWRAASGEFVGAFTLAAGGGSDGVEEAEGLAITPLALGPGYEAGALAVFDEDNGEEGGNVKLVGWSAIAAALGLPAATPSDPRQLPASSASAVRPTVETEPVPDYGDAADDPAIWVDPRDPARSLIIATNKKRGLVVYDLDGQVLQSLNDGRMNNVDLRDGFPLADRATTIVAASNRTKKSLSLYRLDPATRKLVDVAAELVPTGLADPYGLCMYRSAKSGRYYVFINDSEDGTFRQWELAATGGRVTAKPVRDFTVGSQAEGCVADDDSGVLFVAEEDVGLWRYNAEPDGGAERTAIDTVEGGRLTDDVEGLALYLGAAGAGYLVASNQGADNYAVYRRAPPNEFVGFFSVVANDAAGIDGVSETDGLDVASGAPGGGLFVAQDGRNISPAERQNFKLVPWAAIAGALGLDGAPPR